MPYLSVSAVVIHYEEALYQVYAPLPLPFTLTNVLCIVVPYSYQRIKDSGADPGSGQSGPQMTEAINLAIGCHYFPPDQRLPP